MNSSNLLKLARILVALHLLGLILYRVYNPIINVTERQMALIWYRYFDKNWYVYRDYFIDPNQYEKILGTILSAFHIFQFITFLLILFGTKLGPRLLMMKTILLSIIQQLDRPIYNDLILGHQDNLKQFFRNIAIIVTCYLII